MALVNICSAKLCQINNMSSRQEMIRLMDEAITALRQALSDSVEQPTKQRHIAYVCPQCHWTLEEQPAQQEHKPWCASLSALMFRPRPCDCKRVPLPAGDYEAGWNSALEMAAFRLQNDFKRSFGEDTLASIAVYIKEMKK